LREGLIFKGLRCCRWRSPSQRRFKSGRIKANSELPAGMTPGWPLRAPDSSISHQLCCLFVLGPPIFHRVPLSISTSVPFYTSLYTKEPLRFVYDRTRQQWGAYKYHVTGHFCSTLKPPQGAPPLCAAKQGPHAHPRTALIMLTPSTCPSLLLPSPGRQRVGCQLNDAQHHC
jgi:hypothetical protein